MALLLKRNKTSVSRGREAEQLAEDWLKGKGLKPFQKNYHCRGGEIDLLMRDGRSMVVVEVRFRAGDCGFGGAAETVNASKQRRIILAAQHWLAENPRYHQSDWRFDVLGISGSLSEPVYDWVQSAFSLS